jgi:AraC-like DNA-binding protein
VRFGQPQNVLRFPDSTLDSVPAAANAAIAEQIEKFTSALLAEMTSHGARERATDAIRALLGAGMHADRPSVARRLHLSERTLQRHLEHESTSFKALRDGVRSDLSRALLSNRALKVEAIAQSVGFAEVASFSKAFARWAGYSPTGYRERLVRARPNQLRSRRRVSGRSDITARRRRLR